METNYELIKISWNDVLELSRNILSQIEDKKIKIDTIIPVLRGGMPLALLLGYNFENVNTACIHVRSSDKNIPNSSFSNPNLVGITNNNFITGKNILLVDDVIDSGKTIDLCLNILKKYKPRSITIATLYNFNKTKTNIISGQKMDKHFWIVFPWEKNLRKGDDND